MSEVQLFSKQVPFKHGDSVFYYPSALLELSTTDFQSQTLGALIFPVQCPRAMGAWWGHRLSCSSVLVISFPLVVVPVVLFLTMSLCLLPFSMYPLNDSRWKIYSASSGLFHSFNTCLGISTEWGEFRNLLLHFPQTLNFFFFNLYLFERDRTKERESALE